MKLTSVADVRSQIGFDSITDINNALDAALEQTTIMLESELRASFARATTTDVFFVRECLMIGNTYEKNLALSRGLLTGTPTLYYAGSRADLSDSTLRTSLASYVNSDLTKGTVQISDFSLENAYVSATYTSGFEADESDATIYKADQVPAWLKELARMQAMVYLDEFRPDLRREDDRQPNKEMLQQRIGTVLARYKRYFPYADDPL